MSSKSKGHGHQPKLHKEGASKRARTASITDYSQHEFMKPPSSGGRYYVYKSCSDEYRNFRWVKYCYRALKKRIFVVLFSMYVWPEHVIIVAYYLDFRFGALRNENKTQ